MSVQIEDQNMRILAPRYGKGGGESEWSQRLPCAENPILTASQGPHWHLELEDQTY